MRAQQSAFGVPRPPTLLNQNWFHPVVNTEASLHQLSPYIGKLKSSIAADIINAFSKPGDLIVDPFCGAGTIPLEAKSSGRRGFWSDISPYAYTLTRAKLEAPSNLTKALQLVESLLDQSEKRSQPDLRKVPAWVRTYFHPRTLKEALSFAEVCREREQWFPLACLLGILHHQRPGFLSYPSSHLVPYLRSAKFPEATFPELYEYRPLRSRLLRKISRAYKREVSMQGVQHTVLNCNLHELRMPAHADAMITSPPYMNALDYGRDNRLRLWFLDPTAAERIDSATPDTLGEFSRLMGTLASKAAKCLKIGGYSVLVVGDLAMSASQGRTAKTVIEAFQSPGSPFVLEMNVLDAIPDVRRARRYCRAIKAENVIAFKKTTEVERDWTPVVEELKTCL